MVIEHQRCEGNMHCSYTSGRDIASNVLHLPATITFPNGTDMSCSQVNETLLYKWTLSCNVDTGPSTASMSASMILGIILFLSLVLNCFLIYKKVHKNKEAGRDKNQIECAKSNVASLPDNEMQEVASEK